jgi:hypothetical protein
MNPRTNLPIHSTRHLPEAKPGRFPPTGYAGKFQNPYGPGATPAVELAKNACATAVCMNSCAMDVCKHFFWYPFGLEYWFEGANRAFATGMDLGAQLLGLEPPPKTTPVPKDQFGLTPEEIEEEAAEEIAEMEHGMDVAVEAFEEEILA